MLVTWNPEDGTDKQTFDFDPGDVQFSWIKKIEALYGKSYDAWKVGLMSGEITARGILLWYMMTRVHPSLPFKDLPNFRARQLTVDMGSRELVDLKKRVDKMNLSDEDRERFEMQYEVDLHEAYEREGIEPDAIEGQLAVEGGAPKTP